MGTASPAFPSQNDGRSSPLTTQTTEFVAVVVLVSIFDSIDENGEVKEVGGEEEKEDVDDEEERSGGSGGATTEAAKDEEDRACDFPFLLELWLLLLLSTAGAIFSVVTGAKVTLS